MTTGNRRKKFNESNKKKRTHRSKVTSDSICWSRTVQTNQDCHGLRQGWIAGTTAVKPHVAQTVGNPLQQRRFRGSDLDIYWRRPPLWLRDVSYFFLHPSMPIIKDTWALCISLFINLWVLAMHCHVEEQYRKFGFDMHLKNGPFLFSLSLCWTLGMLITKNLRISTMTGTLFLLALPLFRLEPGLFIALFTLSNMFRPVPDACRMKVRWIDFWIQLKERYILPFNPKDEPDSFLNHPHKVSSNFKDMAITSFSLHKEKCRFD